MDLAKFLVDLRSYPGELPKEPWAADQARPQGCLPELLLLVFIFKWEFDLGPAFGFSET